MSNDADPAARTAILVDKARADMLLQLLKRATVPVPLARELADLYDDVKDAAARLGAMDRG